MSIPNLTLAVALTLICATGEALTAQTSTPIDAATYRLATRAQLEAGSLEFDRLAASTAYGENTRARARAQSTEMRRRLTEGDFRVGDRIVLRIEGQLMLDDTVTVGEGTRITVRGFRQVELAGVLRSELETKLRTDLSENVRNATVSARPLMRVAVFGSVGNPGYHSVPEETTLDQLIMRAGGPVAGAAIEKMTLQRADTVLLKSDEVTGAVAQGRTLGALGVLDGDALVIPVGSVPGAVNTRIQLFSTLVFPLVTIIQILRR